MAWWGSTGSEYSIGAPGLPIVGQHTLVTMSLYAMLSCDIGTVLKHLSMYSDVVVDGGGDDSPFRRVIRVLLSV